MLERGAECIALSNEVQARLTRLARGASHAAPERAPEPLPAADAAADAALDQQMARRHVFLVNSDPAFLDVVRVLLQRERYNVTSTNLVAQTYAMLHASGAQVIVIDLAAGEDAVWVFIQQLREDAATRALPVVMTATDLRLLDAAQQRTWPTSGRFHLLRPFDPELLADIVHALVGPA